MDAAAAQFSVTTSAMTYRFVKEFCHSTLSHDERNENLYRCDIRSQQCARFDLILLKYSYSHVWIIQISRAC